MVKRKTYITLLIALFCSILNGWAENSFAENSLLATGKWIKIRVKESGICKITHYELKQWGISNPANVHVYGYGGAMLSEDLSEYKIDDLVEMPVYDGGNYFLFYAQGPIRWKHMDSATFPYNFSVNNYSNYGYYFLTENAETPKRIDYEKPYTCNLDTTDLTTYIAYQMHKKEEFNYTSSGKTWFGDKMGMNESKSFNFRFPNIDMSRRVFVNAITAAYSLGSNADVTVQFGDTLQTKRITYSYCGGHVAASMQKTEIDCEPTSEKIRVTLKYNTDNSSNNLSVERIVVSAYCHLNMEGEGSFFFRHPYAWGKKNQFKFHLTGHNENTQVWDISNPTQTQRIATSEEGSELTFVNYSEDRPREFVALDVKNPDYIKAEKVENVSNQNLHAEKDIDLVIITHPSLMEGAQRLAKIHEETDNMNVLITTQDKIYNEFSSGTPDATAIRWFMKMLYERNDKKPLYLLLLGDGSFDNRGILASNSVTVNNMIITYQGGNPVDESATYTTDDYFTFLDDNEITDGKVCNAKMDISVGRIPASSQKELDGVINKIEKHIANKSYGKWKNRIILLADDNEESTAYQKFCEYSDNLAKKVHKYNPAMDVKKVYLDAYTRTTGANGSRYNEVEALIKEEIERGVFFFNYIGHSSIIGFTAEHVFTQNTAKSIFNENCGFWFTASCQFSQYDDFQRSGGEDLLLNPNGGALGLISSVRVVFDNKNDNLNQALFTHLFDRDSTGMPLRIGDVLRLSKQALPNDSNKLAFNYFGDPVLRLHYPAAHVETDSIQLLNSTNSDTLSALSEVKVYGHISDQDSVMINDFNGPVFVTLYDKEMLLYTKANIYSKEEDIIKNRHTYTDRPNVLFSGQVEAVNGTFSFTFKVPKDINYSYGTGRIAYYAYDEENGYEAQGNDENFIIGGSCDEEVEDEDGPTISLYMNNKKFKSGDKVNSSPVFYAKVSDDNGINASGSGIGHDITLTRSDNKTPIILNNYFTYAKDSYTDGTVCYQLNNLPDGTYTFEFKVWDLLNNSSKKSITFKVDHDIDVEVDELMVYPNPVQEQLTLKMTHTQPQTVQTFRFLLYDVNGIVVYQSEDITAKNDGTVVWTWDLTTQNGRRVAPGCYIGRTEIQLDGKKYTGASKKIIVLPQ